MALLRLLQLLPAHLVLRDPQAKVMVEVFGEGLKKVDVLVCDLCTDISVKDLNARRQRPTKQSTLQLPGF